MDFSINVLFINAFNSDKEKKMALTGFSHKRNLAKSSILRLPFKLFETKVNKDTDF